MRTAREEVLARLMKEGRAIAGRTTTNQSAAGQLAWLVLACFFFSGASGLVYEVVWTRMLGFVFGATALAVGTVLASYMAGLALGSFLLGRVVDRRGHPLALYGMLEIGIGLFALLLPFLLGGLNEIYRPIYADGQGNYLRLSLLRFLLSFALLLVPTTLMGGTLPVLTKFLVGSWGEMGKRLGTLYAVNTFGAVVGTFGAGFFLIPYVGLSRTVLTAVCANLLVGSGAFVIWWRRCRVGAGTLPGAGSSAAPSAHETTRAAIPASEPGGHAGASGWPILLAFSLSGFTALVLEVVWTRLLASILGTTVYAFTTMLTTFLVGIAVGSLVVSRFLDRVRHLVPFLGFMLAGMGLSALLALYLFGNFPEAFLRLYWKWGGGWWTVTGIKFLLAMGAMLLPTFFSGAAFPVVAKIYAREMGTLAGRIGTAYAFNTVGAILGSFAGSFLFLPWLGVEGSTIVGALIVLAVALVLLGPAAAGLRTRRRIWQAAAPAAAALLFLVFRPPWDPMKLSRGVYVYAPRYHSLEDLHRSMAQTKILSYQEEPGGTVSVESSGGSLGMRIDGKVDASTGADMSTQILVAHLPLVFHRQPKSVLVVGLGSGVTVGSVEQYPVEEIECVEISPAVIAGSRLFASENQDCLADARLRLIHGDARNHMLLSRRQYDVIVSQPSNPWISGIGSLFTREFFGLVRERLRPGGIVCQWFHSYQMSDRDFRAIMHTFTEAFPYTVLWMSAVEDMVMLGSAEPFPLSLGEVEAKLAPSAVRDDLARVGLGSPVALLSGFLMNQEGVAAYVGQSPVLVTDDNLLLEFSAARNLFRDTSPIHLANILTYRREVAGALADGGSLPPEAADELARRFEARGHAMRADVARGGGDLDAAAAEVEQAYQLASQDRVVEETYAEICFIRGNAFLAAGDMNGAVNEFERAAMFDLPPLTYAVLQNLGASYFGRGDGEKALMTWSEAEAIDAANADLQYNLGQALSALGREAEAIAKYEESVRQDPLKAEALNNLAWMYAEGGMELERARDLARRAVALAPLAGNYDTLGWVYYQSGDAARAIAALKKSLRLDPAQAEASFHLGLAYRKAGDREKARQALRDAIRKDTPDGPYGQRAQRELDAQ